VLSSSWLPGPLRHLADEIDERIARLPTRLNEYGYDPFGFDPEYARRVVGIAVLAYRYYFRVDARGIENVPEGRVLLIANHAGNTFAWDGAMLAGAMFLEAEPPRMVRGMAEYFLSKLPFFNVAMHRFGSVVGTPGNCAQLLENEEAIMVFPEGQRGFVKTWRERYQLQEFGLGFMRLALETDTPIVPVGVVGGEEQSPGLANLRPLGKLIGSPAFPITLTFPLLGPAGFIPLPVKFHLRFGEPLHFEGDPTEEDAHVAEKVEVVKDAIRGLIQQGRADRKTWFT
jgi:1-acyl-sn-glycerol-3-phosphate acyltransferase